jgi:ABC-2 type transport system permease protein
MNNPDSMVRQEDRLPPLRPSPGEGVAWRRYGRVFATLWRNSVVREMSFKINFLLWIGVELLWFALQLVFISVIYQHTDRIGTWSKWEVVLLLGASQFIQQVFIAFFLTNCAQLSELIRTGKMDFMLLLPINTRFIISLRQVDLGGFINALSALVVMVYAAHRLQLALAAAHVAGFLCLCMASILVHYSLLFLLATVSFWTVRAQGIVWGYYNLFSLARWPDVAFHGFFKGFFTYVIPMLLVANVPVKLLSGRLSSPGEMVALVAMSVLCFILSELVWRLSLRHYTSASS